MERLEHDRRAVREEPRHRSVVDLVADRRAHPAGPCEASAVDDDAVLRHAEERRPQPATREQLVDGLEIEQVVERPRQLGRGREQRSRAPGGRERVRIGDTASQGPAVVRRALGDGSRRLPHACSSA